MKETFYCKKISSGVAEGEILISEEPILFYHTDPKTGIITEHGHCLEGISVKDKILVFPGGKGSSVVPADGMYRLEKEGTAPLGFIVEELDTVLVSSAVIMEMPMVFQVEQEFYSHIKDGTRIKMDTGTGMIKILDRGKESKWIL